MIVQPESRNVTASPVLQRTRASIIASPEAVRRFILPYTQNELAAVRETLNNAADASTRIELQAPNMLEPTARIRDYGPGIPVAQMYEFFSVAGYSTKTQVNETVDANGNTIAVMGCKGVGRFAPLAIAESFMFRNWSEGRQIIGQVYFGPDGMPTVDIIANEASSDPTGVEITFPVNPDRIGAVRNAFRQVLTHFPSHYSIAWVGEPVEVDPPVSKFMGDGWWFGPGPAVLMGRIAYDVAPTQMYYWHHKDLHEGLATAFEQKLLLRVPLGSIDVNDARESIVYNARTYDAINAAFKKVVDDMATKVMADIVNAPTFWEATRVYSQAVESGLTKLVKGNLHYKGTPLDRYLRFDLRKINKSLALIGQDGRRSRKLETRFRPEFVSISALNPATTLIVVDDLKNKALGRRFAHAAESGDLVNLVPDFQTTRYNMSHTFVVLPEPVDQQVLDLLGNPPIAFKLSDLPDPPKAPKQPGTSRKAPITPYVLTDKGTVSTPSAPLDLNDTNVTWAKYDGNRIMWGFDKKKHPLASALHAAGALAYWQRLPMLASGKQIALCIKKFHIRAGKSKWSRLEDEIETAAAALLAKPEVQDTWALLHSATRGGGGIPSICNDLAYEYTNTVPLAKALGFKASEDIVRDFLCSLRNLTVVGPVKNTSDIVTRLRKLLDDKPLLRYLVSREHAPDNLVTDYINS